MSDPKIKAEFELISKKATEDVKDLADAFKKAKQSISALISNINSAVTTIKKLTDYTDEYVTSMRLLNNTFSTTNETATTFIKTMSNMTGLKESTLTNQVALFGQLGKSLGLTEEYSEKLSEGLTTLSVRMSMLYNQDFSTMSTTLQRAIQGTQTTLKSMTGIEVTEFAEAQVLASYGIDRTVSSLNDSEEALVKYAAIVKMVTQENKTYQETVNSVAWQKQVLKAQVQQLAEALGNMLYPILAKILPVLNGIIMALTEIFNVFAKLLGFNGKAASSVDSVSSSYSGLGSSITEAGNAAKKQLRGFDKLNNITTPTSSGSSGGSGLGVDSSMLGIIDDLNNKMLDISNRATEIRDKILGWLGFTRDEKGELQWSATLLKENILKTLGKIWDKLKKVKNILGIIIAIGVVALVATLVKHLKKGATASDAWAKAFDKLAGAIKVLSVGLAGLMILGGIALVIYEIVQLVKAFNESGLTLSELLELIGGVLLELAAAIVIVIAAVKTMNWENIAGAVVILGGMALVLKELVDLINAISDSGMSMSDVLITIGGLLAELLVFLAAIVVVGKIISSDPLVLVGIIAAMGVIVGLLYVLKATLPTILDACGKFISQVAPYVIQLIRTIGDEITKIIYALGTSLPPILDSIGNLFEKIFNGISKVVSTVGGIIIQILQSARNLVIDVLGAILNFINQLGPAINNFVDNVLKAITKLVNFMISAIEYLVNTLVIPAIKKIIQAINLIPRC